LIVAVQAVGLNFRDVLNVLGMYPGDPGPPGGDCAGLAVSGGQGARFMPGEACFGLAPGSLGTHVVAAAQMMASKPCRLGFEEAAAPSTVHVTVDLALWRAGGHGAARVVLVHGAAGGVGLAALDVSRGAGVRAVGSAGSAQKRTLLRRLGVAWTASSRGTGFAVAVALATCGAGCGLVLNSLTSAGMVAASLASLGAGGCLVEISKRDVWSVQGAAMERADAGLRLVALDFLPPAAAGAVLQRLAASLARGLVGAASGVVQSLARARAALRQMSKAQHCGKLVLQAFGVAGASPSPGRTLVTGGLGALGSLISRWLADIGTPVFLTSRLGRADGPCWFSRLFTSGAVHVSRCSSSCLSESILLLSTLHVSTVLHVGGSLSDAVLANQSISGSRKVFSPKCAGSHVLQRSMRLQPLSHFSVFSSISALLGNAGQANCTHPFCVYSRISTYFVSFAQMLLQMHAQMHGHMPLQAKAP
jgi:NADPH:quinone reductase-like Zn-dependent oxidoreductase